MSNQQTLARNRERAAQRNEEQVLRMVQRASLEKQHGLEGHPNAALLYKLAWEEGHSAGWDEVASYYNTLADLLK